MKPELLKTVTINESTDDFKNYYSALDYLENLGYSVGRSCGNKPIGFKKGKYDIMKWDNLSSEDKEKLEGIMDSGYRNDPVYIHFYKTEENIKTFKED